ncbi:MAG: DUF4386 domain-containing protein [Thermoanaerobaculia bacterium]
MVKQTEVSPQTLARIGGALYLMIIVTGLFGEMVVRGELVVSVDATATAANIMASPLLWRLGVAGDLIMHVCDIPLMLIFYVLLRPVNKTLALLGVLFNLVQTSALVAYKLNLLVALFLLGSADYLKAFGPRQLHALMYLFIKADGYGFGIGLIFFGCACLVFGHLIRRSGYLPRTIGILMQVAGVCYMTNSLALLVAPAVADAIFPGILIPAFIGELSFCLWLLVKGVNVQKWEEHAMA